MLHSLLNPLAAPCALRTASLPPETGGHGPRIFNTHANGVTTHAGVMGWRLGVPRVNLGA